MIFIGSASKCKRFKTIFQKYMHKLFVWRNNSTFSLNKQGHLVICKAYLQYGIVNQAFHLNGSELRKVHRK